MEKPKWELKKRDIKNLCVYFYMQKKKPRNGARQNIT